MLKNRLQFSISEILLVLVVIKHSTRFTNGGLEIRVTNDHSENKIITKFGAVHKEIEPGVVHSTIQ